MLSKIADIFQETYFIELMVSCFFKYLELNASRMLNNKFLRENAG